VALKYPSSPLPRNPGPNWGYLFLTRLDRLPRPVFERLVGWGTWVAVAAMPGQREHSRAYLRAILGREPTRTEVWRHFFTFAQSLMRKLRAADGRSYRCTLDPTATEFTRMMATGRPALLGTVHLGDADLLGFMLGNLGRKIFMIRQQVDNSPETRSLARQYRHSVEFIWINERENLLFALKGAIDSGGSVAMQCDRPDFSARLEPFHFLGARRMFPFTIYHLALIFGKPVAFCLGIPHGPADSMVYASKVFEPDDGSREENLARARAHFQEFLHMVERHLRRDPYLWFNFTPLNPLAPAEPAATARIAVAAP
jgi:predicted LPLAT superfamily acyltransferase